MVVRSPVVAGMFYAAEAGALKRQIESCFFSNFGPGKLPQPNGKKVIAAIVPHAAYVYSGAAAAWAYKEIAETEKPDTVIILGPSHTGFGKIASVWQGSEWETPLGTVEIDRELGSKLHNEIWDNELEPHLQEHSIEVQIPFLQYIWKEPPKILPISISAPPEIEICTKIGQALAKAIKESNKKILIIVSSDFTHYGVSYGYLPFVGKPAEVKKQLSALDYGAIEKIEKLDPEGFSQYIKDTSITICGASPIIVALVTLKELEVKKAKLLKYYTSAEITGDWNNSVSYAAIIFEI